MVFPFNCLKIVIQIQVVPAEPCEPSSSSHYPLDITEQIVKVLLTQLIDSSQKHFIKHIICITNPQKKIEIENKDKPKTNHLKYYETKPTNKSNESQTKPTHKSKETQTNPQNIRQNETHRKPQSLYDSDLVEIEKQRG